MTEEEKVARQKEAAAIWATQDVEDLRVILRTSGGRRHIWNLLSLCGVYSDTFRGEDTHAAAYASGKRSVGLSVLENLFTADPNAYTLMRNEAFDRARSQEKYVDG